jgi:DNA-binding Lrp family transcriptional regulator
MRPLDPPLDRTDRQLLAALVEDARLTNKELAARVHLAPSSCHARVQRLIERGVLRGHHAEVHPAALGIGLRAVVAVRLADHGEKHSARIIEFLRGLPEVIDVFLTAGNDDLFLHVAVRDTDHLRRVVLERIGGRSEVADIRTALVYEHHRRPGWPDLL